MSMGDCGTEKYFHFSWNYIDVSIADDAVDRIAVTNFDVMQYLLILFSVELVH